MATYNQINVLNAIKNFKNKLNKLESLIEEKNWESLSNKLAKAKEIREKFYKLKFSRPLEAKICLETINAD